ncbi:hypothetical protein HPP92_014256 [Vanilla planifolia]|uniref:Homeobox domain-containing protein n=1 Tax=Vanilla planifolia TaxID=51239 RepID=A0A835QQK9_VANPL|nr:hypothetical protein HPP92_014256 [Vanilla planifolia]
MLTEKDDLGLSLGLRSSKPICPLQLNLMPSISLPPVSNPHWSGEFQPHSEPRLMLPSPASEERPLLRGIDVNRVPVMELEIQEDAGMYSPDSTVSTGSAGGKRGYICAAACGGGGSEEHDADRCSRGGSDEEDGEGSRKKLRLSKDQSAILEESFKEHNTLNPKQKLALAKQLNLRPRQVEVWFQNRRARTKLKQTEVDCEFLKRCCENLKEENRRLQKEVQELRALKLSPQFYMHMTPPTTLTMCPSCERVAVTNPAASPSPAATAAPRVEHQLFPRPIRPSTASVPLPWAPMALRPSFVDAPLQRS